MIKYNNNTINDWFFSTDNIIKVYRNNAICYYKIDSSSPSGQTPCYAVVEDISQYSDTEFEDVFNKADEKWYKLNNLNQYEEYGVYGSGRTITTYEGKLTIDDGGDDGGEDYSTHYLSLVAQTDNVTFSYSTATSSNKLQYSVDGGSTWADLGNNQSTSSINNGEKIMFKASGLTVNTERGIGKIIPSASASVEGNIMSLAYDDNFSGQTEIPNNFQFRKLFSGVTTITSAENMVLPATTIKKQCYSQMFQGCTSLTTAPTVIGSSAMTWSGDYCWSDMFNTCTSLVNPPKLPALNLGAQCYWYMFQNCSSLTRAPELLATTTATQCYNGMFSGCISLNYIKVLASSGFSMNEWVKNVGNTGTFVKSSAATFSSCGQNTYPCGWTVQDYVEPTPIKYEYIYSGGSWVNVGEVSGSTTQTVWYDPPSSGDNANFNIGHYWGENYKMVWTVYLQGSYSNDTGSFWKNNNKSPIEFSFYNNGYYFDLHDPTSTTSPSVYSGDYSYRIMRTRTLRNYENGQVMDITLTYGSVKIGLVDSGTTIESTGSTRTGYSWYDGLYEPSVFLQSTQKVHVSRIQVYNASNVLVNDLTFVKNNTTGSQEISMYDSVLDVTYNNTNSNTPTYHIVEESGDTEYPIYYDEIQDPPNNLVFSSMAEAEAYECPWVGMSATIDGDKYVFSGDSVSGYEWVYNPSRLPIGYTEVEYIQNTSHAYLDIGFIPNQDTRIVCDMQQVTTNDFPRLWGAGEWNSANGINLNYEGGYLQISWFGKTSWTKFTSVPTNNDRHIYDLNKNNLYVDETLVGSNTYTTKTAAASIGIFCEIRNNGQPPTSGNNPQYWEGEYFKGKMYSFQVYNNGTLARDLVPCVRDNDNKAGAYDLVNDVFYTVPSGYTTDVLVAGNPV